MGVKPQIFSTAERIVAFSGGTTDERIEPSIAVGETPCSSRMLLILMAYSMSVLA